LFFAGSTMLHLLTTRRSGPVAPIERKIGEFDVGLTPEGRQSRPIFPWMTQAMSQMISPMLQRAKEGNSLIAA
jgi:hypothetical protein